MPSLEAAVLRWFVCWLLYYVGNSCKHTHVLLSCSEALFVPKLNVSVEEESVLGKTNVLFVFLFLVCFAFTI